MERESKITVPQSQTWPVLALVTAAGVAQHLDHHRRHLRPTSSLISHITSCCIVSDLGPARALRDPGENKGGGKSYMLAVVPPPPAFSSDTDRNLGQGGWI